MRKNVRSQYQVIAFKRRTVSCSTESTTIINFSEEEINQLNYERYHYPHPLVQKRMEALYLKSQKLSHQQIWDKLAAICLNIPITLILDNARYQKCHLVEEHAKKLGIQLLYLPSYSPHLNLIERLWKLVRNECLYSRYYETFDDFNALLGL